MFSIIPQRIYSINSKSSYDFWKLLSKYYPKVIRREQLTEDADFYPKYKDAARKDKLKAHLNFAVEANVLNSMNSHYEFVNRPEACEFMEALKEGIFTRQKEAFRKFIFSFPLTQEFFQHFKDKKTAIIQDVLPLLRKHSSFDDDSQYKLAFRFFAQTLKKAGLVETYKPQKQLLILSPKFKVFKKLDGAQEQKTLAYVPPQTPLRKNYSVIVSDGQGGNVSKEITFQQFCEIIAIVGKKEGAG